MGCNSSTEQAGLVEEPNVPHPPATGKRERARAFLSQATRRSQSDYNAKVFLSYRVGEAETQALALKSALQAAGYSTFCSSVDCVPGKDWIRTISTALLSCQLMVVFASRTYGAQGTDAFATGEELAMARKKQKEIYVVPMAEELEDAATQVMLTTTQLGKGWPTEPTVTPPELLDDLLVVCREAGIAPDLSHRNPAGSVPVHSGEQKDAHKPHTNGKGAAMPHTDVPKPHTNSAGTTRPHTDVTKPHTPDNDQHSTNGHAHHPIKYQLVTEERQLEQEGNEGGSTAKDQHSTNGHTQHHPIKYQLVTEEDRGSGSGGAAAAVLSLQIEAEAEEKRAIAERKRAKEAERKAAEDAEVAQQKEAEKEAAERLAAAQQRAEGERLAAEQAAEEARRAVEEKRRMEEEAAVEQGAEGSKDPEARALEEKAQGVLRLSSQCPNDLRAALDAARQHCSAVIIDLCGQELQGELHGDITPPSKSTIRNGSIQLSGHRKISFDDAHDACLANLRIAGARGESAVAICGSSTVSMVDCTVRGVPHSGGDDECEQSLGDTAAVSVQGACCRLHVQGCSFHNPSGCGLKVCRGAVVLEGVKCDGSWLGWQVVEAGSTLDARESSASGNGRMNHEVSRGASSSLTRCQLDDSIVGAGLVVSDSCSSVRAHSCSFNGNDGIANVVAEKGATVILQDCQLNSSKVG